ncbi:MAG: tRNA (adenosine(37)-N6)-threonylcarbamoyltransferase complex ATPase subunit type 1 TsaE [Alphaproteobacteria bacterium]|nr:tRNA (adenosine(37)-N6)-threonylcarbamoyltransferase complex ATPase subunit type 1 TsaE [Alphaproteobacteria bacterium]
MQNVFYSESEQETAEIAKRLSAITKKGDIWALRGTLGMGKSVFARAFIQQLTNAKEVPSPTFTLVQMYVAPEFDIYHYDLYRLKRADEIFELGVEEAFYSGVSLVEWPEKMGTLTPRNMWVVDITAAENRRIIRISSDDSSKMERLKNAG